jgi:hypothetical protein
LLSDPLEWSTCVALDPEVLRRALVILVQDAIEAAHSSYPLVEICWRVRAEAVDLWIWHNGKLGGRKLTSHGLGTRYLQTVLEWRRSLAGWFGRAKPWIKVHLVMQRRVPEADFADRIVIAADQPLVVLDDDVTVFARIRDRIPGNCSVHFAAGKAQLAEVLLVSGKSGVFLVDFRLAPNEFLWSRSAATVRGLRPTLSGHFCFQKTPEC